MSWKLAVVPERCSGCKICELVCSIYRFGVNNPKKSAIRVMVVYPHPIIRMPIVCRQCKPTGQLGNLTYWTGGSIFVVSDDLQASEAARTLLVELRHQYVFAFESAAASSPGWRPLDVRLERRGLSVRARSGYYAALARRDGQ